MTVRAALVIALLAAMRLYAVSIGDEVAAVRQPLATLPLRLGVWDGRDGRAFDDDVVDAAGVDEYVNRVYAAPDHRPVSLYVGYYGSQRQGDTIHSPQNCLPGAGWQPVDVQPRVLTDGRGAHVTVNHVVVRKGLDQLVVLYWFQGRARVVASEYANKWWLMIDAARLHRTDGGLVRIIAPVVSDVDSATRDATSFATTIVYDMRRYLP